MGDELGSGNFAVVKKATMAKGFSMPGVPSTVAIKVIDKSKVEDMQDIQARAAPDRPRRAPCPRPHAFAAFAAFAAPAAGPRPAAAVERGVGGSKLRPPTADARSGRLRSCRWWTTRT